MLVKPEINLAEIEQKYFVGMVDPITIKNSSFEAVSFEESLAVTMTSGSQAIRGPMTYLLYISGPMTYLLYVSGPMTYLLYIRMSGRHIRSGGMVISVMLPNCFGSQRNL